MGSWEHHFHVKENRITESGGKIIYIYNRKCNWPVTEPSGTPLRLGASSERTPSVFDRYDNPIQHGSIDAGRFQLGKKKQIVDGVECLFEVEAD